MVIDIDK